jgi:hypothetical protein
LKFLASVLLVHVVQQLSHYFLFSPQFNLSKTISDQKYMNLFYLQVSTESIKDSPSSPEDQSTVLADVVPPVDVGSNDINIENKDDEDDDIEEIFDDNEDEEEEEEEDELELEDEDEVEEDEKAAIVPKKPETKVVTNEAPTKPSVPANKIEEVKVPDVLPKPKDEIKNPEPPKVPEETTGEIKLKNDIDNTKKSETLAKLKPEFEVGEREGNPPTKPVVSEKDASKFKSSEFEIVEREDKDVPPPKPKAEFEIAERGTAVKPVLPPPPPPSSSSTTIKSDPATVPEPAKDNTSRPEVKVDSDDKKVLKPAVPENKAAAHVKFQEDDVNENSGKGHVPTVDFATLEKGETVVKPPVVTTGNATAGDAVEDFLSAEQAHGGQLLHRHHESIQDQQL